MKKIVLLLSIVLIVFTSCSSDDTTEILPVPVGNRLKKVVVKEYVNGQYYQIHSTEEYFYDGDKLNRKVNESGYTTHYYYTGNLITKSVYFTGSANFYIYDSQERVIKRRSVSSSGTERHTDYTYNSDGTITIQSYNITPNVPVDARNFKVFFEPSNIVRVEEYVELVTVGGTINYTTKKRFLLDTKNSPTSAILGFSKLINYDGNLSLSSRNVLSITSDDSTTPDQVRDYIYNQNDFPMTMKLSDPTSWSYYQMYEYTYE